MSDTMHVNNFERDLDSKEFSSHLLNPNANIEYKFDGDKHDLLSDIKMLAKFVEHHIEQQVPRLKILQNYYEGMTANVLFSGTRRLESYKADNRVAHDYPAHITDFINGYFMGVPVKVDTKDDAVRDAYDEIDAINKIDALNRSIGLDMSIYGRAYDYVFRNEYNENRVYKCDPLGTFIIYDNTIEQNSLVAVRHWTVDVLQDDEVNVIHYVDVISDTHIHKFKTSKEQGFTLIERDDPKEHFINRVPITEYRNNDFRRGDFEKVIGLIDLLDNAQADTANYMTDINDALLVVKGNVDLGADVTRMQKESNILLLVPPMYEDDDGKFKEGEVDAEYIYKQYDVSGSEAYKNRINNAIHEFTNTPDMMDSNFAGTQSGEAMKYKVFGLEQRTINKEGFMIQGLERRYKVFESLMKINNEISQTVKLTDVEFLFTRNLPKSLSEELKMFVDAGGQVSQQTLRGLVSFIKDAEEEAKRLDREHSKMTASNKPDEYQITIDEAIQQAEADNTITDASEL
ncbi:phage portal protein [Macrococcus armenti]|uniref:phage portal protein n=1 Tax=Macrococcus armenti TaxID=2875764 RepID=UPI001CCB9F6F|nr:phage portal protein [Macrococcus armenti]UBH16394.1 phage portal protein [Macrococcus armenti]UBH18750.1 phage portal protein [Macrococcus armenti]UBH21022.1 phage portal protein [Macrococcus armenti]